MGLQGVEVGLKHVFAIRTIAWRDHAIVDIVRPVSDSPVFQAVLKTTVCDGYR
jgi:hypothetical protein